jgi:pimeloyl-ACP methyl ester carboxylesterase
VLLRKAIHRWEKKLAGRDSNRVVRPFEWGLEWLAGEAAEAKNGGGDGEAQQVLEHTQAAVASSDEYFSYRTPSDFRLRDGRLEFSSPLQTPYPENNTVHARFLPAKNSRRAVLILPQWNSDWDSHVGLGRMLNWFGISALRMSLPYHDFRKPAGLERADYCVSSNIGRTIHASRQATVDARACLDWLEQQGYRTLGLEGSSLGSCIALLVAAHDARIRAAVFNHISTYFSDVVWTGLSTRHVRQGLEQRVTLEELRRYWSVISPASYLDRLVGRNLPSLLIWATYDLSFLPKFSRHVLAHYRRRQLPHRAVAIPCGHYTMGRAPFKYIDGATMSWFLHRNLRDETSGQASGGP